MSKQFFEIEYTNPETGEREKTVKTFEASTNPTISAKEWAEDYAYTIADKGWYKVTEIVQA